MASNIDNLEWLLNYELTQSVRHRRYLSLVMLSSEESSEKPRMILNKMVRSSDPLFAVNGTIAVLMGDTNNVGALKAVERYRGEINRSVDVRYSVASFPDDAKGTEELIHTAYRRLETAKGLEADAIVSWG